MCVQQYYPYKIHIPTILFFSKEYMLPGRWCSFPQFLFKISRSPSMYVIKLLKYILLLVNILKGKLFCVFAGRESEPNEYYQ